MNNTSKNSGGTEAQGSTTETKSLGEMLIEAKLITRTQLEHAEELQRSQNRRLGDVLVDQGFVSPEDLTAILSIQMNLPFIDLKRHTIQPEALKLVPERIARKHNIIPLDTVDDALIVVMSDPGDIQAINDIIAQSGKTVRPAIGIPGDIREALDLSYKATGEIEKAISLLLPTLAKSEKAGLEISAALIEGTPIVRAANLLITQAIRERASDIHLEPQQDRLRVRYRIDGVLHDVMSLPLSIHSTLISRIKILADMNIAERRRPQDGQLSVIADERAVDIRVATMETAYGEKMVLRILDKSRFLLDLTQLGFHPDALRKYQQMLRSPFGLLLVAGPTGSGKTTTLYASINQLDRHGRNIVTIEDPIEYQFTDINQTQVNPKAGITFAGGLRAIMRQDPNVILIGEMRDNDTANTGVQAALTGHLVLSSIHGNDGAGVLSRLVNLGVEPFLVCSSLIGIVTQRMVRRICPHCRTLSDRPVEEQLTFEKELGERRTRFYIGTGCNFCAHTGYLGRIGIFEILVMSDRIRQMFLEKCTAQEIRELSIKEGMTTMKQDGMLKVKEGITTPSEVMRQVFSA